MWLALSRLSIMINLNNAKCYSSWPIYLVSNASTNWQQLQQFSNNSTVLQTDKGHSKMLQLQRGLLERLGS